MFAFKSRWSFDPLTGEPVDDADKTLDANSTMEVNSDRNIYKWEPVFSEELIQDAGEDQADTPKADSALLRIIPASESRDAEVMSLSTTDTTIPTATISTIHMIEVPSELLETSTHEDFLNLSTGSCGSLETVSPRDSKFKSPKSMKQCRITGKKTFNRI